MNALPEETEQRLRATLCRWAHKRYICLRVSDYDGARRIGNWLFGVQMIAQELGFSRLAELAIEAQGDNPIAATDLAPQVRP